MADCKHCGNSNKVFRHYSQRPFDAFYLCRLGRDKDECDGKAVSSAALNNGVTQEAVNRIEDAVAKRGTDNLGQSEIDLLIAANAKG